MNYSFLTTILPIIVSIVLLFLIVLILLLRKRPLDVSSSFEKIFSRLEKIERLTQQMDNLERLFVVPRTRGGIGEVLLENLLANWLPRPAFDLQYTFKNGARADAVIRIGNSIVAIDAKFPVEAIRGVIMKEEGGNGRLSSELKKVFIKHAADIASKYIQPSEGTLDFAMMYIPSEKIYYIAFVDREEELLPEMIQRRIVPVSPGNLFLYLKAVAYGLRGFSLREKGDSLSRLFSQLRKDLEELKRSLGVSATHFKNLQKAFEDSLSKSEKTLWDFDRIEKEL